MEIVTGGDIAAVPAAHRVTWFVPDRPVDGGTVFKRPVVQAEVDSPTSLSEGDTDD
jgi:hypothetical protein